MHLGGKRGVVRLALRVYDLAGNASSPLEVTVDLGQPQGTPY